MIEDRLNICVRGLSEADVMDALRKCGLTISGGKGGESPTTNPLIATIVMIGTHYRSKSTLTVVKGVLTEYRAVVPGYHANLRVWDEKIDLEPLERIVIYPESPSMVIM